MLEFLSTDFVKLSVPLLAAVVAWFVNERSKRAQEEYTRKEQKLQGTALQSPRVLCCDAGHEDQANVFRSAKPVLVVLSGRRHSESLCLLGNREGGCKRNGFRQRTRMWGVNCGYPERHTVAQGCQ